MFLSGLCAFMLGFLPLSWGVHTWKSYPRGSWDFELQTRYEQATANYLSQGNFFQALPSGQSYKLITVDAGTRYHFARWALFGEAQLASAESRNLTETRVNSGFSQAILGADYLLYQGRFAIIPEVAVTYPFVRNSISSDAVSLNEGAIEGSSRLIFLARFWRIRWATFLGFTYRDGGRSSLLPYGLFGEFQFRHFVLGNELRAYQSVSYDQDTNADQARKDWATRVNAGSQKFYSVNPSGAHNTTWARFVVDRSLWMQVGAGMTLNGSNSGAGWNVFLGVLYRERPKVPVATSDVDRFQIETNEVDQDFFEPTTQTPFSPLHQPLQNDQKPNRP